LSSPGAAIEPNANLIASHLPEPEPEPESDCSSSKIALIDKQWVEERLKTPFERK